MPESNRPMGRREESFIAFPLQCHVRSCLRTPETFAPDHIRLHPGCCGQAWRRAKKLGPNGSARIAGAEFGPEYLGGWALETLAQIAHGCKEQNYGQKGLKRDGGYILLAAGPGMPCRTCRPAPPTCPCASRAQRPWPGKRAQAAHKRIRPPQRL